MGFAFAFAEDCAASRASHVRTHDRGNPWSISRLPRSGPHAADSDDRSLRILNEAVPGVHSHDRTTAPAIRVPLRRNSSSARNASSASANSDRSTHSASVISLEYSWVFISPLTDATLASGARLRRFRDVATQRLCHRLRSSFFPPRPVCGTRLCRSRGIHLGTASIRWGSR